MPCSCRFLRSEDEIEQALRQTPLELGSKLLNGGLYRDHIEFLSKELPCSIEGVLTMSHMSYGLILVWRM